MQFVDSLAPYGPLDAPHHYAIGRRPFAAFLHRWMMAHHYVIGRLDRWIRIVMSFVDHRPLDARRGAHEASPLVQSFPMRRAKETQEKIGAYFVSSSILDPRF
jgi:hypothetical protein